MGSSIYFPVRANAHSLLAGGPAASVRRRLIISALMHDLVLVDDGAWHGHAGPTGSWEMRFPPERLGKPAEFQTARSRAKAKAGRFFVAVKPTGSPGPARPMVTSDTTIAWEATFEPIKRELPRAYPWLEFLSADLHPDDKRIVKRMVDEDAHDGVLDALIPDQFSRKLVIGGADMALVLGSRMQAAVSMDPMHRRVIEARLRRGQASPIYGADALAILFPTVDGMAWDDVDAARNLKGLPQLRALLAEIEEAAWAVADTDRQLADAVREDYLRRFHDAVARIQPSLRGTALATVVGLGIGLVTGPLAPVVGLAAGAAVTAAGAVNSRLKYERSWLAAASRLSRGPR